MSTSEVCCDTLCMCRMYSRVMGDSPNVNRGGIRQEDKKDSPTPRPISAKRD